MPFSYLETDVYLFWKAAVFICVIVCACGQAVSLGLGGHGFLADGVKGYCLDGGRKSSARLVPSTRLQPLREVLTDLL